MARITFRQADGAACEVDAPSGYRLMSIAIRNCVPGIPARCGGACTCATCRVDVEEPWRAIVGEAGAFERALLDYAGETGAGARLACQVRITEAMDGLVLCVPDRQ